MVRSRDDVLLSDSSDGDVYIPALPSKLLQHRFKASSTAAAASTIVIDDDDEDAPDEEMEEADYGHQGEEEDELQGSIDLVSPGWHPLALCSTPGWRG